MGTQEKERPMIPDRISEHGLILIGAGKMGSAMLDGWLKAGLDPQKVNVIAPRPSDWVKAQGVRINDEITPGTAIAVLAVKPQKMGEIMDQLEPLTNGETVFISVAAGLTLDWFTTRLGDVPVVKVMPNTPSAVGKGMSLIVGNDAAGQAAVKEADALMQAVGETVILDDESQMSAAMALSGCGPAYAFHLMEAMEEAGIANGLPPEMAQKLAVATVNGAGALASDSPESPQQLRINVCSPGGVTAAAMEVLMDEQSGFKSLMQKAVQAALKRDKELG
ncbi:pyrroline-5-carboxylate reductase [Paracoccaceae bacterium GXU_MW_L88]